MDRNEIQALINEKIAGQGNQVDAGGALAEILDAILDLVATATIIDCTYDNGSADFEFTDEQKAALKVAFDNGALSNTILRGVGANKGYYGTVVGAIDAEGTLTIVYALPEGGNTVRRGTIQINK